MGNFNRYIDDVIIMRLIGDTGGVDTQPPYITNRSPASGATGVPTTQRTISFHIKDDRVDDDGVDQSTIYMTVEGVPVTPVISGNSSDFTVSYTNSSDWTQGQVVDVTLRASDAALNILNAAWSFTVVSSSPTTLNITTTTLPNGTKGTNYSQTLSAEGGTTPYSWSIGTLAPIPADAPYPPSSTIVGVAWDFVGKVRTGQGSDLWPVTWGGDDKTYIAWGDGGGMDGTNTVCRTRFGFAELTGTAPSYGSTEIWGCKADGTGCKDSGAGYTHDAACDASYGGTLATVGVPDAIIAVDNTTYALVADWATFGYYLLHSTNYGQSWTNDATFGVAVGNFMPESFVQHGAGDAGGSATYLYILGEKYGTPNSVYLARAPKATVTNKATWGYFTGTATSPSWGSWSSATPVFYDPNSTYASGKMQYFPVIQRYVYTSQHGEIQKFGMYEAVAPWGPWKTVYLSDTWGGYGVTEGLWYNIIPKSISGDDKTFYMTFSGYNTPDNWDNYNLIKGTFTLASEYQSLPTGLSLSSTGVIYGIPTKLETQTFTVKVTDAVGGVDNQSLTLVIKDAVPGGQTTVTGLNIEDTFINSGGSTTNYSTENYLQTYDWPTATVANKILIMDNTDILGLPDNISITSATLRLYLTGHDGSGGYNPATLKCKTITDNVPVISTVTWDTYTGLSFESTPLSSDATGVSASVSLTPGWVEWNVLTAVQSAYATSTPVYFAISDGVDVVDTNRIFASHESETTEFRPQLVVTYTPLGGGLPLSAPGRLRVSEFRGKTK